VITRSLRPRALRLRLEEINGSVTVAILPRQPHPDPLPAPVQEATWCCHQMGIFLAASSARSGLPRGTLLLTALSPRRGGMRLPASVCAGDSPPRQLTVQKHSYRHAIARGAWAGRRNNTFIADLLLLPWPMCFAQQQALEAIREAIRPQLWPQGGAHVEANLQAVRRQPWPRLQQVPIARTTRPASAAAECRSKPAPAPIRWRRHPAALARLIRPQLAQPGRRLPP